MDIVLRLRELRRLRGMRQEEVAESSGVGVKSLSSFETGVRITSIKVSQLLAILSAYDTTAAEFFGGVVERQVLAEFERLSSVEASLITGLRSLPDVSRERLTERLILMIEAVEVAAAPARLRALF